MYRPRTAECSISPRTRALMKPPALHTPYCSVFSSGSMPNHAAPPASEYDIPMVTSHITDVRRFHRYIKLPCDTLPASDYSKAPPMDALPISGAHTRRHRQSHCHLLAGMKLEDPFYSPRPTCYILCEACCLSCCKGAAHFTQTPPETTLRTAYPCGSCSLFRSFFKRRE